MRKEVIAGLLVLLMLAAAGGYVIMNNDVAEPNDADNSDGTSEENNLIDDEWDIYYVESNSELPECNYVTQGRLYYVASTSGFEACTIIGWASVNLTGPEGLMGPAGVDGVDGDDGINGTNGIDGSDGADGLDGADGQNGEDTNQSYITTMEARIAELESQVSLRNYPQPIPPPYGESVDNQRSSGLTSFQEQNIARDSTGRIHVVYRGVHNGMWTPMYTSGDGINWDSPMPIRTTHYNGVADYYTPSLIIDSQDRLHVVFSDYGNIAASTEKMSAGFSYSGYGYVGYYARCDNCSTNGAKEWTEPFTKEVGGGLLPATSDRYQFYFNMAVDKSNDDVYITWREDGASRTTVAYKITSTGFTALPGLGDAYLSQNIVVDNDNRVLFVGGEYYNEGAMKIYELSDGSNSPVWLLRDKLIPRIRDGMSTDNSTSALGGNDGLLRHYRLSTTVDKDNYVHILVEVKDAWHNDIWRIMYYEFNSSESNPQSYNSAYSQTGNKEGKLREVWVNPVVSPSDHTYHPSITVDDGINGSEPNVHIFWWKDDALSTTKYSSMERGGDEFTMPLTLFNSRVGNSISLIKTPEIAYVDGENNVVIDLLFVLGAADLRYYSMNLPLQYENHICQIGYFGECGGANLRGMDLSGMDLRGMDFRGADLSGVDFSGSLIDLADFTLAEIEGANFSNTYWMYTTWIDGETYYSNPT